MLPLSRICSIPGGKDPFAYAPVCTGIPVSRKKILMMAHPPLLVERARCTNVDPCDRIRPTLSACCDETQLLLGILIHLDELTNRGIPTAVPSSQCLEARFRRKLNPGT